VNSFAQVCIVNCEAALDVQVYWQCGKCCPQKGQDLNSRANGGTISFAKVYIFICRPALKYGSCNARQILISMTGGVYLQDICVRETISAKDC
jgi:hypothetical protein